MSHDDFAFEPVRGLPAALPPGERLQWQGSPDWKQLAVRAYHVRKIAVYFLLLMVWRIAVGLRDSHDARSILISCLFLALLGGIAVSVLSLLAYLNARSTVYSITSKRVLLRHGVAVPITMNVPFKLIDNAALRTFKNGTGDISLALAPSERIGYIITWPHIRPGRITRPEPSLRALLEPAKVAEILGQALAADAGATATAPPAAGARLDPQRQRAVEPHPAGPRSAAAA